ncbi:DUF4332 domain-containing protein [Halomarina ordinaria]|uniref:DUF4332 domain-containing protein n=1 Tax=Halomarina ordinaria TaxID=3033939 RepID=A0ABD5U7S6_9EURY|nr:DUF4332 domain-containing protein [Halomarina sp. PSRA2]
MSLFEKIKSALGIGESSKNGAKRRSAGVTVEREPSANGTDEVDEAAAAETDAAASTGSITEEPPEGDVESAAEPAEAAGPASQSEQPSDVEPSVDEDEGDTLDEAEADTGVESPEETESEAVDEEEAAGSGTDAAASTETMVDEQEGVEPGEAAGPGDAETGDEAAEPAEAAGPVGDAPEEVRPVTRLKGIGPAYAETLEDAGVESIDDLANADAAALSEETGISEKRLQRWVDRAQER